MQDYRLGSNAGEIGAGHRLMMLVDTVEIAARLMGVLHRAAVVQLLQDAGGADIRKAVIFLFGQIRDRRQEVVHLLSQQVEYLLTMVPNAGNAVNSSATSQFNAAVASPSQFGAGK